MHHWLGLRLQDPATTWPTTEYVPPRSANHETDGNSRWHLALILSATLYLVRRRERAPVLLLLSLIIGTLLFCAYLKWQPFMLRMLLPLYVAGVCAGAIALARAPVILQTALCLFLLDGARLPLLKNWIRPLVGPSTVLNTDRNAQYFADMTVWNVRAKYEESLGILAASPCRDIAMDINSFQLEYPLQAILLQQHPDTRFVHVKVSNPSRKYENKNGRIHPCIEVCLACERWVRPLP